MKNNKQEKEDKDESLKKLQGFGSYSESQNNIV